MTRRGDPFTPLLRVHEEEHNATLHGLKWLFEPMGHFKGYGRNPRAALALDRSLREVEPGVYEVTFQAVEAGVWYVFLESAERGLEVRRSAGLMLEAVAP